MTPLPSRLRLLAALALALVLPFAAGCGKKEGGDAGASASSGGASAKKIVLYDTGIEPANKASWVKAIGIFEKAHPSQTVDLKIIKDDDYSQGGRLIAALQSKNPPHIYFEWAWASTRRDGGNGAAIDLGPYITPEWKATFDPRSWAGCDYNGKTYMVPFSFDAANLLFYRKKTLADHGIAVPKTWGEFLDACKKLKAAGVQPIVQGNQGAWTAGNWAAELSVCYLGLDKFKLAGTKPPQLKLADPGFVQAVTRLKELYDAKAFNEDMNTLNDNEGLSRFVAGEGAFIFAGSWVLDTLTPAGGAEVFGIMTRPELPGAPAGPRFLLANSTGYLIHKTAPDPAAVVELLKIYTSAEVQKDRVAAGFNSTNIEAEATGKTPLQAEVRAILAASEQWVAAPDISWERLTAERFYEAVKSVVGGEAEPLAALEAADKDVAAALK